MKFLTLLLFFSYTNLSLALGLGEIELKSNLNEPLFAQLLVTDVDKMPESGCISIIDISDIPAFKKTSIALQPVNGNFLLTIRSVGVVTEAIINLRVALNCGSQFHRDYVLLLDPAILASSSSTIANKLGGAQDGTHDLVNANQQIIAPATQSSLNNVELKASVKLHKNYKKKKLDKNKLTSINKKQALKNKNAVEVIKINKVNKPALTPLVAPNKDDLNKPSLVISSGNANKENLTSSAIASRLDPASTPGSLDQSVVDQTSADQATVNNTDELTVMINRLAHLEKQLVTLENKNTQLLADVNKNKNIANQWSESLFMGLGLLLTILGTIWAHSMILNRRAKRSSLKFHAEFDHEPFISMQDEANVLNSPPSAKAFFNVTGSSNPQNVNIISTVHPVAHFKDDSDTVIENAEVFIEHNRPALAIQLLQNHLVDFPKESPAIWLKLLNLLAQAGTKAEYDNVVVECNKYFNIHAADFENVNEPMHSSIEDYPHIINRLEGIWGSAYAVEYLNDLIYNQQSQPREGFEQNTFEELFILKNIAEKLHPANGHKQDSIVSYPAFDQETSISSSLKTKQADSTFDKSSECNFMFEEIALDNSHKITTASNFDEDALISAPSAYEDLPEIDTLFNTQKNIDFAEILSLEEMLKSKHEENSQSYSSSALDYMEIHLDNGPLAEEINFTTPYYENSVSDLQNETNATAMPKTRATTEPDLIESELFEPELFEPDLFEPELIKPKLFDLEDDLDKSQPKIKAKKLTKQSMASNSTYWDSVKLEDK